MDLEFNISNSLSTAAIRNSLHPLVRQPRGFVLLTMITVELLNELSFSVINTEHVAALLCWPILDLQIAACCEGIPNAAILLNLHLESLEYYIHKASNASVSSYDKRLTQHTHTHLAK
jgi:hypothetical protein